LFSILSSLFSVSQSASELAAIQSGGQASAFLSVNNARCEQSCEDGYQCRVVYGEQKCVPNCGTPCTFRPPCPTGVLCPDVIVKGITDVEGNCIQPATSCNFKVCISPDRCRTEMGVFDQCGFCQPQTSLAPPAN